MPTQKTDERQDFASSYVNRPLHAQLSEIPQRTPVEVRLGLALLPSRYILRGFFKSFTDSATPESVQRHVVAPIRDKVFSRPLFRELEERLAQTHVSDLFPSGVPEDVNDIARGLRDSEVGKTLIKDIERILRPWDAKGNTDNLLQYAVADRDKVTQKLSLTDESKSRIRGKMAEPMFELMYDNSLGLGSLAMTFAIRQRVRNDIKNLYTEAVAYEMDKDPAQVTMQDIFESDNTIIKSTVTNYKNKFAQRLGISALPFLKNIPALRAPQFGDMAVGLWGAMWVLDVWWRQPTNLEMLSDFVNDKLNPKFGISDSIRTADVINLYQRYATKFKPEWAFKSVLTTDVEEANLWAGSEKIFQRIADLMNDTYSYKHTTQLDPVTGQPIEIANFTLPKFIYLTGHDLINPNKPDWSMAYVQLANEFGMETVKEVRKAQLAGVSLNDVLKKYPVDINPSRSGRQGVRPAVHSIPTEPVVEQKAEMNAIPAETAVLAAAPETVPLAPEPVIADKPEAKPDHVPDMKITEAQRHGMLQAASLQHDGAHVLH